MAQTLALSAFDFANRVTKTRRDHTGTPPGGSLKTYYIREEYTYDAASRLRFTRHHIKTTAGVPTSGWVVTSAPLYDELSRLVDKRLHASNYFGVAPVTLDSNFNYLQSLDYTFNIRGWLTGINNPTACTTQSGDQLADLFTMGLDYESTANGAAAQYNGNISAMQWRTNVNGSCLTRQQYRFTYDYANRLLTANHFTHNGTTWINTNNYSESNIAYDFNGNIKTYNRRGQMPDLSFNVIDNLTYTYGDAARPDRLTNVSDAGNAVKGFKFTSGSAAYTYDLNGNLTQDNHKSLTLGYNYLNLPNYITNPGGSEITVTYTADGEKLRKISPAGTRNYISGIEYLGTALDAIYHAEGRCTPNGASAFYYEYTLKDHLGNARINFRANGAAVTFLQELHYYPFGMVMEGIGTAKVTDNGYKYNGKELNDDLGLNLSDYGARWYDANLGRWWGVDPMGEKTQNISTYAYVLNNPMIMIDPTGMESEAYGSVGNLAKYSEQYEQQKRDNANEKNEKNKNEEKGGGQKNKGATDPNAGTNEKKAGTSSANSPEICIPCVVVIIAILVSAPEVDKSKTMDPVKDEIAIQEAEQIKNDWLGFGLSAPVRAESYLVSAATSTVGKSLGAKKSNKSGKERATDIPSWAKGQKPEAGESGKDFAKRLLDQTYGPGNYGTGPTTDYNKLKKYGDRNKE